jgi:hypothetical protein
MTGIELIAKERQEQIKKHGRTVDVDVQYNSTPTKYNGMMPLIMGATRLLDSAFKWSPDYWNQDIFEHMISKNYKERLVIAAALIAAEIDRIQEIENK